MKIYIFGNQTVQKHRFLSILLLSVVLMVVTSINANAVDWTQQVDRLFRKWDNDSSPGCAIAVVHEGKIVYKKGYGMANLRYDVPITPTTVFRAASNSKQFTALSILLLEEEGLLFLDDDIHLHLPELPDFGKTITIRHLLHHTSGLRDFLELMFFAGWSFSEDLLTKDQGLAIVSRQKALNFDPGDQFMYSNTGFMLLAEIVARISGKTFAEFTKERIFDPLGMTNSQFVDNTYIILKNYADSYYTIPEGELRGEHIHLPVNHASIGEAGLHTTVEDLTKWDQNFYNPIVGNHTMLEKMHQKDLLNDGSPSPLSMGLIVDFYQGKKLVYHGGDLAGFHGNIVRFPDQHLSVLSLANTLELASNVLLEKSIQTVDYFLSNQETPITDFNIHEPSMMGWGMNGLKSFSPDLEFLYFLMDLNQFSQIRKTGMAVKSVAPQISPEAAEEYLGRYYSEELDIFYTLSFDDAGNILFKNLRRQPYLISTSRVTSRGRIIFNESSEIKGEFFRNSENQVIGFKISNSRALNMEFLKAEVTTQN